MTSVATLFEYQKYPFILSNVDSFEEGTLFLTDKTLELLEELNVKGRFLEIGRKTIKPLNQVGVVKINNLSIQIFPKLFKAENSREHLDIVAGNLLKMLSYSGNIPITEMDIAALELKKVDLYEIFIHLFAKNLLHTIKSVQYKEYVKRYDEIRVVRGRINFKRYTNPARKHIIPCHYFELSPDNLMNQTLKYCCYLMSRTVSDFSTIRMLRSITDILEPVTLVPVTIAEIDRITFTRLNRIFEPYIGLCRIFLANSTLTLQSSRVESFSLLIPMEILFEEFISAILSADPASFFGRYVRVRSQMTIGRFARDEKNRELFSLRPDIVIGWPVVEAIIDIKYKQLDPGERKMGVSQLDLYQMFAYVTKTGAHRCMLLYPDALVSQARDFFLSVPSSEEENVEIPLMVRAIPLSYDLNSQDGWDTFLKRLREIVRHLVDLPATSLEGELAGVEAS